MYLNCTKLNNIIIKLMKTGVYVANKLFLTFLHIKSKKKVHDENLDFFEKITQ